MKHTVLRFISNNILNGMFKSHSGAAHLSVFNHDSLTFFFNQLAAATDRIGSLQEEQQQLKHQNELIRERSEKSVEVRHPVQEYGK